MKVTINPLSVTICAWICLAATPSAEPIGDSRKGIEDFSSGRVVVAAVTNKVEAREQANGPTTSLKNKDVISEGHTVIAGEASAATLVFSNGATINVQEKSTLVISEFLQNPFSTPFAMAMESEELSASRTKLNLKNGEIVCKVKKLRKEDGSSLTVETPVGAAGVRGTTFACSYILGRDDSDSEELQSSKSGIESPDGDGTGTFTLSVTEGEVSLKDLQGNETIIPAGKEIVITFRTALNPTTGEITVIQILSSLVRDIPPARLNMINQVANNGDAHSEFVIFKPAEGDVLEVPHIATGSDSPVVISDPDDVTPVDP